MKRIALTQFIILLAGTLFAWTNFILELINWLNKRSCTTACVVGLKNPFLTPCFFGAVFFTLAFILSIALLKKSSKLNLAEQPKQN